MIDAQRHYQVTVRNARYQQWQALLTNRAKRQQSDAFLIQGVRPIGTAVERGWPVRTVLTALGRRPSSWASGVLGRLGAAERVELAPELLRELGEKDEDTPELIVVAQLPPARIDRIPAPADALVLAFDRPANPGNLGTLVRSADAFGAHGVIVTGHAADPYDPRAVRASTGSLFAVPVVPVGGVREVLSWVDTVRAGGTEIAIVGTDESGAVEIGAHDLTGPTLLAIGSEARGMSRAWRDACDAVVRIPIRGAGGSGTGAGTGAASSLNAAAAGTVALYEAARQRRGAGAPAGPPFP